jgi:hypothetical protein
MGQKLFPAPQLMTLPLVCLPGRLQKQCVWLDAEVQARRITNRIRGVKYELKLISLKKPRGDRLSKPSEALAKLRH